MAGKSELQINEDMRNGKTGLRKFTFAELGSMLHGLLFAYEKVFINLYGNDARQLYPYLMEELTHILHTGDDPIIDKSKSLEENIDRIIFFISNEEYLKDINFEKTDDGQYVFKVGACSFAKSGVHDILKIKEGICPFALVIATCLTELTANGYIKITKSEFDDEGSTTYLKSISEGLEGEAEGQIFFPGIDDEIFAVPAAKSPLDDLDLNLIRELRKDARKSNVDLAKILGTTESTVRRRINGLIEKKYIRGFTTMLQYAPGDSLLRVFLGLKVDPKHMNPVAEKLSDLKETCSVYKSIGKHNLVCEALFLNRSKFQEFIDQLQYMEGVLDVDYSIGSSAPKPCPWYGF